MTQDRAERRDTPLARQLKASLRRSGPISVRDYVGRCLTDPAHGYYRHQDAIGRTGDFVTAPEISQTFGELLGLWAATVWREMGAPRPLRLIEIGPGRGTLMRDMLRAARVVPDFLAALDLHLVEISARLKELQRQTLVGVTPSVVWHDDFAGVPTGPTIVIANELLDALPARQIVHRNGTWRERGVGLDGEGHLSYVLLDKQAPLPSIISLPTADEGSVLEIGDFTSVLGPLHERARISPTAALLIDYGHDDALALGDTLQAVRKHVYEHPLTSPGEADLSFQVNFGQLIQEIATRPGTPTPLAVDGPKTQAAFLGELGLVERASRLMAANPRAAATIEAGVARLMAPTGMGGRFKAVGVRSAHLPVLPGLSASTGRRG